MVKGRKQIKWFVVLVVLVSVSFQFLSRPVYAADPSFEITPSLGYVKKGEYFYIDIMVDSAGQEISLARSVLTFDPKKVKIYNIDVNQALFCEYPDDRQSTDNENGVVVVEGFCQSGGSTQSGSPGPKGLYLTDGDSDVFVRIEFQVVGTGEIPIVWEYTGNNEEFKTVLLADGSPPQNVLMQSPDSVTFIGVDGSQYSGSTPSAGLFDNTTFVLGLFILILAMITMAGERFIVLLRHWRLEKKYKTLVIEKSIRK